MTSTNITGSNASIWATPKTSSSFKRQELPSEKGSRGGRGVNIYQGRRLKPSYLRTSTLLPHASSSSNIVQSEKSETITARKASSKLDSQSQATKDSVKSEKSSTILNEIFQCEYDIQDVSHREQSSNGHLKVRKGKSFPSLSSKRSGTSHHNPPLQNNQSISDTEPNGTSTVTDRTKTMIISENSVSSNFSIPDTNSVDFVSEGMRKTVLESSSSTPSIARWDWSLEEDDSLPSLDDWNIGTATKKASEEDNKDSLTVAVNNLPEKTKDNALIGNQTPKNLENAKTRSQGDRKRGKGRERGTFANKANLQGGFLSMSATKFGKKQQQSETLPFSDSPFSRIFKQEEEPYVETTALSIRKRTESRNESERVCTRSVNESESLVQTTTKPDVGIKQSVNDNDRSFNGTVNQDTIASSEVGHHRSESMNPGSSRDQSPKKDSFHTRTQSLPHSVISDSHNMRTRMPQTSRPIIAASAFQMITKSLRSDIRGES